MRPPFHIHILLDDLDMQPSKLSVHSQIMPSVAIRRCTGASGFPHPGSVRLGTAWRRLIRRSQRATSALRAPASVESHALAGQPGCLADEVADSAGVMLDWIADLPGALRPNVSVDHSSTTAGRRLKATRDLTVDDTVISVPLTAVFADNEVRQKNSV